MVAANFYYNTKSVITNEFFARTNNVCENFHSVLNYKIPHKSHRASILLDILLNIEYKHRSMLIAFSQGQTTPNSYIKNECPLPFEQIHAFVQSLLPSHDNKLLSLVKSQSFKDKLKVLSELVKSIYLI